MIKSFDEFHKLNEYVDRLPSYEVIAGLALAMGALDVALATKDKTSIVLDIANALKAELGSAIDATGAKAKQVIDKYKTDAKVKKIIQDADRELSEGLTNEAVFSYGGLLNSIKMKRNAVTSAYNTYNKIADRNFKFIEDANWRLAQLEDERADLIRDMEEEAEPEGGKIADTYGGQLNVIDDKISTLSDKISTKERETEDAYAAYKTASADLRNAEQNLKTAISSK